MEEARKGLKLLSDGMLYTFGAGAALELFLTLHGSSVNTVLEVVGVR